MGRRINEQEDVVQARSFLEQATVLLDAAGLIDIAVHTDYAKQMLDQNIIVTPKSNRRPSGAGRSIGKQALS